MKKKLSEAREKFSRSFQDCIDLKKNAAIAIQRYFKRYRRQKRSGPIVLAEKKNTMRRKYAAIRIQNCWRWQHNKPKWKKAWKDAGGHEALERLEMHRMHDMHLLSGEGLSGVYDDVNERNTLKMRKEFLYDIVLIQKVCRMWLAKRRTDDLRLIRFFRQRNRRRNVWNNLRGGTTLESRHLFRRKHDEIITWYINVKNECARVDFEVHLEEKRMSKAWKKWDSQMTNIIMSRPLGREWLPQLDKDGNPTSYLNLNTGHEQTEHPFMRYVKAYRKREFAKAQETLSERLNHLTKYKDDLLSSEKKHRLVLIDEAKALE